MKAWATAAGKLARYEHIGWREWPHRRGWSFQSAATPISGRTLIEASSARGSSSWSTLAARAILGRSLLAGEGRRSIARAIRRAGRGRPRHRPPSLGGDHPITAGPLRHHESDVGAGDDVAEPIVVGAHRRTSRRNGRGNGRSVGSRHGYRGEHRPD